MARLRRPSLILIILCAAVSLCQCFPSVSQSLARSRQQPLPTRRQKVKSTSPDSGSEKDGSSTVTSSIFNLVKGIVGAGTMRKTRTEPCKDTLKTGTETLFFFPYSRS